MENQAEVLALRDQVAMMADQVSELRRQLDSLTVSGSTVVTDEPDIEIDTATTRRGWMKAAAAAAVGGTAVALGSADRVAAADTDSIKIGQTNNVGDSRTVATQNANSRGEMSFLFRTEISFDGRDARHPSALGGWTGSSARPSGVYGFTEVDAPNANGVVGRSTAQRAVGVRAENSSLGGTAMVAEAPINGGTGVKTQGSYTGVDAAGDQFAVIARSGGTGLSSVGDVLGLVASGREASMLLASVNTVAPPDRPESSKRGSLTVHSPPGTTEMSLGFCADSGTPGVWRKIAGSNTAGTFHPIVPTRAYDSRAPEPEQGLLAGGSNRVVSVADGRDLETGAVVLADVVPKGATAVTYNLTITETVGAGFLALTPGSETDFAAAAINWSTSGVTVGNAAVVKLNSSREIKVFCEVGSTHFVLDITGYYL